MELIEYTKLEIEGLKNKEISLYKNDNIYEIHEHNCPIIVISLGEQFGRDKFKEIVNGYRLALISMGINFKLIDKKEKTMEEKIKEVQDYFKNKLLKGEFETNKITDYWIKLVIDSKYNFFIWMANQEVNVRLYESECNFMLFDLSSEERKIIWDLLNSVLDNYKATEGLRIKREAYNKLAIELGKPTID